MNSKSARMPSLQVLLSEIRIEIRSKSSRNQSQNSYCELPYSTITQIAELPIKFLSGEVFNITFYVTPLNSSCSTVIGYNWLKQYNPLIDWSSGHITFHSAVRRGQAPMTSSSEATPLLEPITPLNFPMESP